MSIFNNQARRAVTTEYLKEVDELVMYDPKNELAWVQSTSWCELEAMV